MTTPKSVEEIAREITKKYLTMFGFDAVASVEEFNEPLCKLISEALQAERARCAVLEGALREIIKECQRPEYEGTCLQDLKDICESALNTKEKE